MPAALRIWRLRTLGRLSARIVRYDGCALLLSLAIVFASGLADVADTRAVEPRVRMNNRLREKSNIVWKTEES